MADFKRVMRSFLWLCVGLMLGGVATFASAESIPATLAANSPVSVWYSGSSTYSSLQAAATERCLEIGFTHVDTTTSVSGAQDTAICKVFNDSSQVCAHWHMLGKA